MLAKPKTAHQQRASFVLERLDSLVLRAIQTVDSGFLRGILRGISGVHPMDCQSSEAILHRLVVL